MIFTRTVGGLLAAALAWGCAFDLEQASLSRVRGSSTLTREDVALSVTQAAQHFTVSIAATSDAIVQQSADRNVRRRALLWKVRVTPLVQRAALTPQPIEGLLELLALATAQRQYLTDGGGQGLFGATQELAIAQARELESDMSALASSLLDAQQAAQLEAQVEALARKYPIRGEFLVEAATSAFDEVKESGAFEWVVRLPLAPFRALEGVEGGALAIRDFNATTRQFNTILAGLPQQARWQIELLLYDLEDRDSVLAALASMEKMATSAEQLSRVAETLPVTTREQISALLRDADASQVELRRTIAALQQSIDGADRVLGNVKPLLEGIERTALHVERAGVSWGQLVRDVQGLAEPRLSPTGPPPRRSFDVVDYERTAAQIGVAAVEVRSILTELPQGSSEARAWVDFALWRLALLVSLWFGLSLASRLILARVTRT